jgi:xylulokinase
MWVQEHEPHVWERTFKIMGSYDYINMRLTGVQSLEANWAVESGLYDIRSRDWIERYLDIAGIGRDLFPPVRMPTEIVGRVNAQAAHETGLQPGTPVVAGSGDHIASALSAGMSRPGDLLVKFGGGGDVLFCTTELRTHPRLYFDLHDIPGHYIINGCMAASGSVVKWFAQNFVSGTGDDTTLQDLDREAESVPPGSDGLVLLPYFLGEKTPLFDPLARGVVFGLALHHTRAHVFRAILEAVSYGFRHHVDELEAHGFLPERVYGTNGGSRSRIWQQITADVLGRPITYYPHHPGSALGVAFVAAMGVGLYSDWSQVSAFVGEGTRRDPDRATHEVYNRAYAIYRDLYRHLREDFVQLAALYRAGAVKDER